MEEAVVVAVGMLLVWGGYSVSLWGWCLLRGYDVTFGQITSPSNPYGSKGQPWPPAQIPANLIFPGTGNAAPAAATAQPAPAPTAT
jgi:hypothetical protein